VLYMFHYDLLFIDSSLLGKIRKKKSWILLELARITNPNRIGVVVTRGQFLWRLPTNISPCAT